METLEEPQRPLKTLDYRALLIFFGSNPLVLEFESSGAHNQFILPFVLFLLFSDPKEEAKREAAAAAESAPGYTPKIQF